MASLIQSYLKGYLVRLVAFGFLTWTVVATFCLLVMSYVAIWGSKVPFMKYILSDGDGNIEVSEIMYAYGVLTIILMIITETVRAILKFVRRTTDREPEKVNRRTYFYEHISQVKLITVIFLFTVLAVFSGGMINGSSFEKIGVSMFFYIIAVVNSKIFMIIDNFADRILTAIISEYSI